MNKPPEDRLIGVGGLGLALLGVGVPYIWKDMPTYISYPMVAVGVALLLWSAFHGVYWHSSISRVFRRQPDTPAIPPPATPTARRDQPEPNMRLEDVVKRITGISMLPESNDP